MAASRSKKELEAQFLNLARAGDFTSIRDLFGDNAVEVARGVYENERTIPGRSSYDDNTEEEDDFEAAAPKQQAQLRKRTSTRRPVGDEEKDFAEKNIKRVTRGTVPTIEFNHPPSVQSSNSEIKPPAIVAENDSVRQLGQFSSNTNQVGAPVFPVPVSSGGNTALNSDDAAHSVCPSTSVASLTWIPPRAKATATINSQPEDVVSSNKSNSCQAQSNEVPISVRNIELPTSFRTPMRECEGENATLMILPRRLSFDSVTPVTSEQNAQNQPTIHAPVADRYPRDRNPPEQFAYLPSCYFLHDILFS